MHAVCAARRVRGKCPSTNSFSIKQHVKKTIPETSIKFHLLNFNSIGNIFHGNEITANEHKPYVRKVLCVGTKIEHPELIERPHHHLKTVWP